MNNFDKLEKLYPNSFKTEDCIVIQHENLEFIVKLKRYGRIKDYTTLGEIDMNVSTLFRESDAHREAIGAAVTSIAEELDLVQVKPKSELYRSTDKFQFISKKSTTLSYVLELEVSNSFYRADSDLREVIRGNLESEIRKVNPQVRSVTEKTTLIIDGLKVDLDVIPTARVNRLITEGRIGDYKLTTAFGLTHAKEQYVRDLVRHVITPSAIDDVPPITIRDEKRNSLSAFHLCMNTAYCIEVKYSSIEPTISEIDTSQLACHYPSAPEYSLSEKTLEMKHLRNTFTEPHELNSDWGLRDDKYTAVVIPVSNIDKRIVEFIGVSETVSFIPKDVTNPGMLAPKFLPDITPHITERFDKLAYFTGRHVIGAYLKGNTLRLTINVPTGAVLMYIVRKDELRELGFERLIEAFKQAEGVSPTGDDLLIPTTGFTGYVS